MRDVNIRIELFKHIRRQTFETLGNHVPAHRPVSINAHVSINARVSMRVAHQNNRREKAAMRGARYAGW